MKYTQIFKYEKPDENGNKYGIVRYHANGTLAPFSEMDKYRSYIQALIWARKWNKIIQRGLCK